MRILLYGINYAPELTGIGKYSGELGSWLAQQKHDVEVITAHAYYPEWQVHQAYKRKGWFTEIINNVKVRRSPLYVPKEVTALKRMVHEFSFLISSLFYWCGAMGSQRHDLVICVAPAFHLAFPALFYAKLRSVPIIYHVQDLQIDAARDLGMIKNRTFLSVLLSAEKFIFRHATKVSTISEGMLKKIEAKGIVQNKCILLPNWVDNTFIHPVSKADSLRSEFGFSPTDRIVLYSGALGEKQGLELIVETAHALRNEDNLYFVIIGSGGAKQKLEQMVADYQLTNVKFFPLQPYEKLSATLAIADIHLVLQKKLASDLVMPSKLTTVLAAGGCPLVTALPNTSLFKVVHDHKLGILVEPESVEDLSRSIQLALSSDLNVYRDAARQYAKRYLDRDSVLKDFEQELLMLNNSHLWQQSEFKSVRRLFRPLRVLLRTDQQPK